MKIVLEFNDNDCDELRKSKLALASYDLALSLWEFRQELATCMNDGYWQHEEATDAERDFAEKVLKRLGECLEECGCCSLVNDIP